MPMDTDEHTSQEHPEELLAAYVEGSSEPPERQAVESHLDTCAQCRSDVELATSARAAMASLPELEAPGLAGAGLDGYRSPATSVPAVEEAFGAGPVPTGNVRRLVRRVHWDRVALGAGLAAAAGLFVIFAVIGIARTGGGRSNPSRASSASNAALPPVIARGAAYSATSLQALAGQLRAPAEKNHTLSKAP